VKEEHQPVTGGLRATQAYLGIDIGASKSHALIADGTGRVLGFGEGGPGNYESSGWDRFRETLHEITHEALSAAGLGVGQVAGAGLGVAGYDWPSEAAPILAVIDTLGLQASVVLVNDALIGLAAGASQGWGVVVTAGTSVNAWGRDRQGRKGRMIGYGGMVGEYAGAWELVERAVVAVGKAWTRRGPATRLTQAFLALTGAADEEALFEGLTLRRLSIPASAAPLVFELAAEGDRVAQGLIHWAGQELGSLAVGIIRQLEFQDQPVEVVLSGSFFRGGPTLIRPLEKSVLAEAPRARFVRLTVPPVVGGVLLGMERAGLPYGEVRHRLLDSTIALLSRRQDIGEDHP
jgi:N-acetylglucosamine kinase-like BadF-type ATPase